MDNVDSPEKAESILVKTATSLAQEVKEAAGLTIQEIVALTSSPP